MRGVKQIQDCENHHELLLHVDFEVDGLLHFERKPEEGRRLFNSNSSCFGDETRGGHRFVHGVSARSLQEMQRKLSA